MLDVVSIIPSSDGSEKYWFRCTDYNNVLAVKIPKTRHISYCISCQIGCINKCRHCATGQIPYVRDLSINEIVTQVLQMTKEPSPSDKILFMGMGEPLFNLDNVLGAIDKFIESKIVMNLDKVIISTSGVIPGITELSKKRNRVRLAITLGTLNSKKREYMIPITKIYPIDALIAACKDYQDTTNDRLIFQYPLLKDFNDTDKDIEETIQTLQDFDYELHIIPFNEFEGAPFERPSSRKIKYFYKMFESAGVEIFEKPSKGVDVHAGCGQLDYTSES